jgi:hypothetical protein
MSSGTQRRVQSSINMRFGGPYRLHLQGTMIRNVGFTRPTRRHIQEDDILHSDRHENLKSYIALTGWAL